MDYAKGAFTGVCAFSVEALEDGHYSRLGMRFRARPRGPVALLARVAPIDVEHSRAARDAFARMAALLETEHTEAGRFP